MALEASIQSHASHHVPTLMLPQKTANTTRSRLQSRFQDTYPMAELSTLMIGIIGLILTAILAIKYRCIQCLHRRISAIAMKISKFCSNSQATTSVSTVNSEADDDFDYQIPRPAMDVVERPSYHEYAYGHPTFGMQTRFFARPMVLPPPVYLGTLRAERSRRTPLIRIESASSGQEPRPEPPRVEESLDGYDTD
ncbi:hypothetical protein EDC01DRAFT_761728 [Geopyxis carbonaria]|nr:hypothetical protein EDC01DRAFT_761728 [Geopyxis carbonaria]